MRERGGAGERGSFSTARKNESTKKYSLAYVPYPFSQGYIILMDVGTVYDMMTVMSLYVLRLQE